MIYPEIAARTYAPGIGDAVADRTVNRKIVKPVEPYTELELLDMDFGSTSDELVAAWAKENKVVVGEHAVKKVTNGQAIVEMKITGKQVTENWADVARRVAVGNSMLDPRGELLQRSERRAMEYHLRQASVLMSGRHLQHGDENQAKRPMEVFTNCSTSASTFLMFYLLLSGSGVGRCYDNDMILVDFNKLPTVVCVLDASHADAVSGEINILDRRSAEHLYQGKTIIVHEVEDSREGWAKALEKMELMAYQGVHRDSVLLLDFSKVRCRNSPIMGMQGRPASGPGPIIGAIANVAKLRDAGMEPWRAAMYADHYIAECVLVGGARRAARMATKTWRDKNIFDFINVKRGGFLWSSNNSVTVDVDFWASVTKTWELLQELDLFDPQNTDQDSKYLKSILSSMNQDGFVSDLDVHAYMVFDTVCRASYFDGTGEPGLITVEKLAYNDEGVEVLLDGNFAESARYKLETDTLELTSALANAWQRSRYKVITNPCGEIVLIMLGAYCVIADIVPFFAGQLAKDAFAAWVAQNVSRVGTPEYHAEYADQLRIMQTAWDADAEDAFRVAARALIRTNLMDSLYAKEVRRTNRIGVGMTGLHEYAFARFGYGWKDLVDESASKPFWNMLARFKRAVQDEAASYSELLGVVCPHTDTTMKPAGTTSKLFSLTEGAHLPSMREYLRWVQFRNGDPIIAQYEDLGYPTRRLRIYEGTTIVGFPTRPAICELGMGDKLVTAAEATPEEQYAWLRNLEKYYIIGVQEGTDLALEKDTGNQVSYTLKYDPKLVGFDRFLQTLLYGQSTIRCCSVMPQIDGTAYEYQPEEPTTRERYEAICMAIEEASGTAATDVVKEDIGLEHVDCAGGACPVDFRSSN